VVSIHRVPCYPCSPPGHGADGQLLQPRAPGKHDAMLCGQRGCGLVVSRVEARVKCCQRATVHTMAHNCRISPPSNYLIRMTRKTHTHEIPLKTCRLLSCPLSCTQNSQHHAQPAAGNKPFVSHSHMSPQIIQPHNGHGGSNRKMAMVD